MVIFSNKTKQNPSLKSDINLFENIHHTATRMAPSFKTKIEKNVI